VSKNDFQVGSGMKRYAKLCGVFLAAFCTMATVNSSPIKIACKAKGREAELIEKAAREWEKKQGGRHKVEIITLPRASNECLALYLQWLSTETFDVDVFQVDVAWIDMLADYLYPLDEFLAAGEWNADDHFDVIRGRIYHDGKIIVLPWYTDCGMMYYRKDLLEKYNRPVPKSWEELLETAMYIQTEERKDPIKKNRFYGLGFPAKAFEELTCSFLELIDSFGGSMMKDGMIVINSPECIEATKFLVKCFGSIINRGSVNHSGEEVRGLFQSGNAVFMRNWPYAWSLMNEPTAEVAGKVGVMPIPPGGTKGKPSGALGGWFLAVSKYSKHPRLAADLVKYFTDEAQQRIRSEFSYLPTRKRFYEEANVLENNPLLGTVYDSLMNAVARPSSVFRRDYIRASTEIFNTVNTIITESVETEGFSEKDIKKYLDRLERKLSKILEKASVSSAKSDAGEKSDGLRQKVSEFCGFTK
jgi:trehalose/maltose transport system substrate-binding protein